MIHKRDSHFESSSPCYRLWLYQQTFSFSQILIQHDATPSRLLATYSHSQTQLQVVDSSPASSGSVSIEKTESQFFSQMRHDGACLLVDDTTTRILATVILSHFTSLAGTSRQPAETTRTTMFYIWSSTKHQQINPNNLHSQRSVQKPVETCFTKPAPHRIRLLSCSDELLYHHLPLRRLWSRVLQCLLVLFCSSFVVVVVVISVVLVWFVAATLRGLCGGVPTVQGLI